MTCPICLNNDATVANRPPRDESVVDCPQCLEFTISGSAPAIVAACDRGERWKISAWVVQNKPEILTTADIENAVKSSLPNLNTRADRVLSWLHKTFPAGAKFSLLDLLVPKVGGAKEIWDSAPYNYSQLTPVGWCRSMSETNFMVDQVLCSDLQFLTRFGGAPITFQINTKGLLHLEGRKNEASTVGFCAMWFSDEVKPIWTSVIEPAIRSAGYEPLRIDSKQHNGKIDDEIMASIRSSRFVVADFTGSRGGVYYEAGFAHGLGLPVIFMCREGDELHFDIRQYNCIFWKADALEDAQTRLKNRILATLGQGLLKV